MTKINDYNTLFTMSWKDFSKDAIFGKSERHGESAFAFCVDKKGHLTIASKKEVQDKTNQLSFASLKSLANALEKAKKSATSKEKIYTKAQLNNLNNNINYVNEKLNETIPKLSRLQKIGLPKKIEPLAFSVISHPKAVAPKAVAPKAVAPKAVALNAVAPKAQAAKNDSKIQEETKVTSRLNRGAPNIDRKRKAGNKKKAEARLKAKLAAASPNKNQTAKSLPKPAPSVLKPQTTEVKPARKKEGAPSTAKTP
ncbi:MAG: hypothetical protein K0S07_1024 [Chlamydiales bacterium]|jgi:hypothetical protein|nr:hypothetical protein [Chlamydiales bacterium]